MSENKSTSVQVGPGAVGLLGLIFVLCKVFGYGPIAHWSWLWVLAPFWISAAVIVGVLAITLIVLLIVALADI